MTPLFTVGETTFSIDAGPFYAALFAVAFTLAVARHFAALLFSLYRRGP